MTQTPAPAATVRRRSSRWVLAGYAIAVVCLVWVYYDFDWSEQWRQLLATDWRWIVLAVALNLFAYVIQGLRWHTLLKQVGDSSLVRVLQAVFIGLMANEILPLRAGEAIRCYLVRRWTGIYLSVVISSVAIERLLDGLWHVFAFYLISSRLPLPGYMVQGGRVLLLFLLACVGLMTAAIFYHKHAHNVVSRSRWKNVLRHVVDGVYHMGRSKAFVGVVLLSLAHMAAHVSSAWALMRAYGMEFGVLEAAAVVVVLRIITAPPGAPGNVGSFQAAVVLVLQILDVDRQTASSYATVLFLLQTIPHLFVGLFALASTRTGFTEIHHEANKDWEQPREARPPGEGLTAPPRD